MSWPQARLFDISEVVTGSTPSTFNVDYYGGDIPFITPTQLSKDIYVGDSATYVTQAGAKAARLIPKNSVMVCCIGSLGKVGISSRPLITNQQINSLVINENIADPLYVYFYCRTLSNILENMAPKTTVAIVNKSRFSELTIPLPPLATQKHIARVLEQADQLRKQAQQMESELNQLAQSLFLEMFGVPDVNPHSWATRSLESLVVDGRPITYGILKPGPDLEDGIPYVRVVDMKMYGLDTSNIRRTSKEIAKQYKRSSLAEGDVLLSIRGHVGRVCQASKSCEGFNITQDTARIAPDSEVVDGTYLMYYLGTRYIQALMASHTKGAAVKGINLADVKEIPVVVPPIEIQKRFSTGVKKIQQQLRDTDEISQHLESMFGTLMQRAFNGELTAPERKAA